MDVIETNQIITRLKGRTDKFSNLQALYKHCHIEKSLNDRTISRNEEFDVSQILK